MALFRRKPDAPATSPPRGDGTKAGQVSTTSTDHYGRSDLHYAALENRFDDMRQILSAGADPNCTDRAGWTPLHAAASANSVDALEVLLEAGATVDAEDAYGNTPLWRAIFNKQSDDGRAIQVLRNAGADPLHLNKSGRSPLAVARLIANYDIARHFSDLPDLPRAD